MPACEHLVQGRICAIASNLGGMRVPIFSDSCEACQKQEEPKAPNRVTASIALAAVQRERPEKYGVYREKLRCYIAGNLGPGSYLRPVLASLGVTINRPCSMDTVRIMNNWGPEKCRQNMDRLVRYLSTEAENHNFKSLFAKTPAANILTECIERSLGSS